MIDNRSAGIETGGGAADRDTHRVEGFSDGFFAIVITLLALDLRVPSGTDSETLADALRSLWPIGLAYVVSFVNIYILWVSHHELMRIATRVDTRFLYLNGALLFGIGVMPFSTALLADFALGDDASVAAGIFTGDLLWIALWLNALWRYLAEHPERLLPHVSPRDRRRISKTYAGALVLYVCAFALSWASPLASIAITLVLAIFFAAVDRISGFASEDIADAPMAD